MQTHSVRGERIILSIEADGMPDVARIVRHHHEHFNGSGYPDNIAGESIPVMARILSVVDSYDAIAMPRPYHASRNHDEVIAIPKRNGAANTTPSARPLPRLPGQPVVPRHSTQRPATGCWECGFAAISSAPRAQRPQCPG